MSEYLKEVKEEEFGFVGTLKNLYSVEEEATKKVMMKNYFVSTLNNKSVSKTNVIIERALIMNNAMVNFDKLDQYGDMDFIKLFDTKNIPEDLPGLMASYQDKNGIYPLTKITQEYPHLQESLIVDFCNNFENINLDDLTVKMSNLSLDQLAYLENIAYYYERKLNSTKSDEKEKVMQLDFSLEY